MKYKSYDRVKRHITRHHGCYLASKIDSKTTINHAPQDSIKYFDIAEIKPEMVATIHLRRKLASQFNTAKQEFGKYTFDQLTL